MPQQAVINGWPGGLNRSKPAKDIEDNEVYDVINMELTNTSAMRKRGGTAQADSTTPFGTYKIRSMFPWRSSSGAEVLIVSYQQPTNSQIWRVTPTAPGSYDFTNITGSLTLPADPQWYWAVMDGKCVGVNGATSGTNHIQIPDQASVGETITPSGGTFPNGKYIENFARRLWVADADNPNTLNYSALGDYLDWSSTGSAGYGAINVGEDEGDYITGIKAWKSILIIFKFGRIYTLTPGSPNTDASQFNVKVLTDSMGAVDANTIQELMGDVVFLSEFGLASLQATAELGDMRSALLSSKVPELNSSSKTQDMASALLPEKKQYWLSLTGSDEVVYVLDFEQFAENGPLTWTKFDGDVVAYSYAIADYQGVSVTHIGSKDAADVLIYQPESFGDYDGTNTSAASFRTKAYSLNEPLRRKEFYRFGVEFEAETDPVTFQVDYRLDQDDARIKSVTGQFSGLVSGSLLDGPDLLWDTPPTTGSWYLATEVAEDTDLVWGIRGNPAGRRAQTIQYVFQNDQSSEGYKIKRLMMEFDYLGDLANVSDYSA
jgi:hypothetical protein